MIDFEYKEVKTKKGKTVIFCNFEELLTKSYGVSTMEEVEPFANSNGEYICHCKFCKEEGHTKHKLYIRSDLTTGYCFVCNRVYINIDDKVDTSFEVPDFLGMLGGYGGFNLVQLNDPVWSLDKFKYEFDDYSEVGYNYLVGRHKYLGELYKLLGFKFWNDNVVIPFFYGSDVFYYQIRFTGNSKIRYFLPPISSKPPYIIPREGEARHRIMLVEGIFDAIAVLLQCPDYTPVAVLGSSISDYQLNFIREYAGYINEVRLWFDETKISAKVADIVKRTIDYCPMSIIKSYGPDPENILQGRIKKGLPLQWIFPETENKSINNYNVPGYFC